MDERHTKLVTRQVGPGEALAVYTDGPLDGQFEIIKLRHGVPPPERRCTDPTEFATAMASMAELEQIRFPKIGIYRTTGGGSWGKTEAGQRVWFEVIYGWRGWE